MHMRNALRFAAAILLFLAVAVSAQDGWQKASDTLIASLEKPDDIPGARGIGGVVVDRHCGDVIVVLNGAPWGVYRSKDAGTNWHRLDDGKVGGGWVRSFSIQLDQDKPGRMAFFRVSPPGPSGQRGPTSLSALTVDDGKTWTEIVNPKGLQGFGGWVHGMVDWKKGAPLQIIAQSRIRPYVALSPDGGKTFDTIGKAKSGIIEVTWNHEYSRSENSKSWKKFLASTLTGYGVSNGNIVLGRHNAIEFSEDQGKTFRKVSDFVPAAHTPVQFGGKLYWGAEKGVIASADDGKTWSLLGSELPMVRKGPFFGADVNTMVVVTENGVFRTSDTGATWTKISELFKDPTAWRADTKPLWLRHDYAWDHTRKLLYVAGMAGTLHKKEVK